jgi:hypothetical protein
MTRSVQNKTQISVQLSISTTGAVNQKFDALTDNLRFLHSLHNKTISFNPASESTNSVFVRAVPLDAVVSHILQESDAAISPQYSAAPRGRPWGHVLQLVLRPCSNTDIHLPFQHFKVQAIAL